MIEKGKQDKEKTEALKRESEAKAGLGEARVGIANAKATGHADTDVAEASRPGAHKTGEKANATSGVHGLKMESSKRIATSGFSLGSGGAHFAPKNDKAEKEKEQKELTPEQLELKALGMLKKTYTPVAKEAAAVGAQKIRDAEAAKTTPPKSGPYEARPASAFGSRTQMTWGTNPKAETPTSFRHIEAPLGSRAPTDRIDSRSMVDDPRQRALMQPRPTLLSSHRIPGAADFEKVSEWNDRNRKTARALADSHGNRAPAGGWPKLTGNEENKQNQSIREIDQVLRHPEIQVEIATDTRFGPVIRYRAPEKHQEGVLGVVNTGRGAVYDKNGLLHLLSDNRPPDILKRDQDKHVVQEAKNKAKKEAKNASTENK